jgi:putative transposase
MAKNVTVSREGKHWFVSIQTEFEIEPPVHPSHSIVGIDLGVVRFATLSNGEVIPPVHALEKKQIRLKRYQRRMARRVKFSNNWKKAKAKVASVHRQIANIRNDFLHQTTTAISKNHAVVVIEDLEVWNMSQSARGTVDNPGRNVKQKAGLNPSILDQSWSEFRRQLEYKLEWAGGRLIAVPARYTSRTCPHCGHHHAGNRKTRDAFVCLECGYATPTTSAHSTSKRQGMPAL